MPTARSHAFNCKTRPIEPQRHIHSHIKRQSGKIQVLRHARCQFINNRNHGSFGAGRTGTHEPTHERRLSRIETARQKLGSPNNLTIEARSKGLRARQQNAVENENNRKATALIMSLRNQGDSFYSITKQLNVLGFLTRRNKQFQQNQVMTLYNRFAKR